MCVFRWRGHWLCCFGPACGPEDCAGCCLGYACLSVAYRYTAKACVYHWRLQQRLASPLATLPCLHALAATFKLTASSTTVVDEHVLQLRGFCTSFCFICCWTVVPSGCALVLIVQLEPVQDLAPVILEAAGQGFVRARCASCDLHGGLERQGGSVHAGCGC
jgi:hypothetical protein